MKTEIKKIVRDIAKIKKIRAIVFKEKFLLNKKDLILCAEYQRLNKHLMHLLSQEEGVSIMELPSTNNLEKKWADTYGKGNELAAILEEFK